MCSHRGYKLLQKKCNIKNVIRCPYHSWAYDLKGNLFNIEANILSLVKLLKNKFPKILVNRIDERFTSKIAKQTILDSGIGKMKRRSKENIDKISATLILQSYLKKNNYD